MTVSDEFTFDPLTQLELGLPSQTSCTNVQTIDDQIFEGNETFTIELIEIPFIIPELYTVQPITTVTIVDNDGESIHSGAPLLWTLWGSGEVSCIERCPHFRGKFIYQETIFGMQQNVLNAEVSLFQGSLVWGSTVLPAWKSPKFHCM